MENNTWQIDEDLYKVHLSADVFKELIKEFEVENTAKYIKDGEIFAYDIMVTKEKLKRVNKKLKEIDC
jgi:hypothetical protein|tara:strand:- start:676 stop:879 length:204 start_codon:yes stop_codon:yes gene_type:complete